MTEVQRRSYILRSFVADDRGLAYRRDQLWLLCDRPPMLATIVGHAHGKRMTSDRSPVVRILLILDRELTPHTALSRVAAVAVPRDEEEGAVGSLSDAALIHAFLVNTGREVEGLAAVVRPNRNVTLVGILHSAENHSTAVLAMYRPHHQSFPARRA